VIGFDPGIQQIIEDSVEQSDDGHVPFIVEQSETRAWYMVGKPAAVGGGHHTILRPMPDNDGACTSRI
jgi:hypothetical protein